jgi:citrate lyase subunit beta/citryl-CoA lyase
MQRLRSWLFIPGSDLRKLEKVRQLNADVVIYDLEDAVAPSEKGSARLKVKTALTNHQGITQIVRVNGQQTPYFTEDVREVVCSELHGIMLPKSESPEQIADLAKLLEPLEQRLGLNHRIRIIPLIETAVGVRNADQIAQTGERVQCMAFGSIDYSLDIGAELTQEGWELLYPRSILVNASRAAGLQQPIDTVYPHTNDLEGLKRETNFIKKMGFQGKLAIHPNQIEPIHEVFAPSIEEVQYAMRIVEAYEKSLHEGVGAVRLDGKMIDLPVVERAKKIIQMGRLLK